MSRVEAGAVRDAKRVVEGMVRFDRLGSSLADLLGAEVDVMVGRARCGSLPPFDDGVAILLARADEANPARAVLVEVEGALAGHVVARALHRAPPVVGNPAARASPSLAGSFAAVAVAAARRAHVGTALRVLAAGTSSLAGPEFARHGATDLVTVSLTVLVARDAFAARVVVSREVIATSAPAPWDTGMLAALGVLPLALPLVACATTASAAEVASLGPGDAFIPVPAGHWPLSRGRAGHLTGPVLLSPPSSALGLRAELGEDGRLVLRGGLEPLLFVETPMDPDEKDTMVVTLGEVPVVVRVEIGEAVLAAREWASLGRGDVVALGRRVGEPVILRVAGLALARGELVDLEGEVAVRIIERLGGESAAGARSGTTP